MGSIDKHILVISMKTLDQAILPSTRIGWLNIRNVIIDHWRTYLVDRFIDST